MSYLPYIGTGVACLAAGFLLAYFACRRTQARLNQEPPKVADPLPPTREGTDGSYFERLIKYIPGELVAAYLALDGILREAVLATPTWAHWAAFIALLILSPIRHLSTYTQRTH